MIRVKFVKMTRNPEVFAVTLEKVFNELLQDGWQMLRSEYDAQKGMLLIAHKPEHPLAGFVQMVNQTKPAAKLSSATAALIDEILTKSVGLSEGINEKSKAVIDAVCRRYPNPVLRVAIEEIRKYCEHHADEDHEGEECSTTKALINVADGVETHVRQSVV